jgi:hypothetical protein
MNVSLKVSRNENSQPAADCNLLTLFGVPYGNRTRVAAVKEKRPVVIQKNFAAWVALYRTPRTHGNAYWTLSGRVCLFNMSETDAMTSRSRGVIEA